MNLNDLSFDQKFMNITLKSFQFVLRKLVNDPVLRIFLVAGQRDGGVVRRWAGPQRACVCVC